MGCVTPFTAGFACFLGREFMRRTLLVRRMATLSAGLACLLRRELMRGTLLVRGMATLAGYLALLLFIHGSKTASARSAALSLAGPTTFLTFLLRAMRTMSPGRRMNTLARCVMPLFFAHGSRTPLAFIASAPVISTPVSI
jgi:hypothetical protein